MTDEELVEMGALHKWWLDGDIDGRRADLTAVTLSDKDLNWVNESWPDLRGMKLRRPQVEALLAAHGIEVTP